MSDTRTESMIRNNQTFREMVTRAGVDYRISRDPETGLQFVYANGTKIGQTQTEAGAKLIRRNHARKIERRIGY